MKLLLADVALDQRGPHSREHHPHYQRHHIRFGDPPPLSIELDAGANMEEPRRGTEGCHPTRPERAGNVCPLWADMDYVILCPLPTRRG